jgi:hypothetical protein
MALVLVQQLLLFFDECGFWMPGPTKDEYYGPIFQ